MMLLELGRFDEGLLYCLFDTPDRVQHMFWRYREPNHPAHKGKPPTGEFAHVIDDQYRRGDAIVGKALEFVDDKTLLIVLSDHGFGSFQRGVHLNTWLYEQNLLAFREGIDPLGDAEATLFPKDVDWSRTKAFALGLGGIYLNLEGREGQGIVKEVEAEELKRSIADGLTGLVDPAHGAAAIRGVKTREELYQGPFAGESPDLTVHFERGHRVSWRCSLGKVGVGLFEDNVKKWSGDHIVDPARAGRLAHEPLVSK